MSVQLPLGLSDDAPAPGEPPTEAWAAALASFPAMTAHRLRLLLRHLTPQQAFAVATGQAPPPAPIDRLLLDRDLARRWAGAAGRHDPNAVWQRCTELGVGVAVLGRTGYPWALALDRAAPAVLFHRGDLAVLERRRVGIVGTRNATLAGRSTARRFGRALAAEGVAVVSGLARGVDGEAHRGALDAGGAPVGVVASGLDVVYPPEHGDLWQQVAESGVLLSEAPPGTAPEAHRFPLRNRVLAALSEVLLVVESRASGGSLITAREARDRGIDVLVVPGSTASRASEGTNLLARDGAGIALDPTDVLVALGLDSRRRGPGGPDPRLPPQPADRSLLDLFDGAGLELEELVARSGRTVAEVALALGRLEGAGWVADAGGWFERVEAVPGWP
jgi:DNA processing protein